MNSGTKEINNEEEKPFSNTRKIKGEQCRFKGTPSASLTTVRRAQRQPGQSKEITSVSGLELE